MHMLNTSRSRSALAVRMPWQSAVAGAGDSKGVYQMPPWHVTACDMQCKLPLDRVARCVAETAVLLLYPHAARQVRWCAHEHQAEENSLPPVSCKLAAAGRL